MADLKITQLPSASTLLTSSVFPVVVSGVTDQVTLYNLTANAFKIGSLPLTASALYSASYIDFNTLASVTQPILGRLSWNQTDKTLDLGTGDGNTTLQIGQETVYPPIVNADSINLVEGTLVMVDPTDIAQGNRIRVVRAVTNGTYPSQYIVGVLTEDIDINQEGFATWFGYVRNLNIPTLEANGIKPVGESWAEGNVLFANPTTAGGLTKNQPEAPNIDATIAVITAINGNNLTLLVRPTLTVNLGELNNIKDTTTTSSYGDLLSKSGSVWTTGKQLTGSYGVTGSWNVTGSGNVIGSLDITGSGNITGSLSINGNMFLQNSETNIETITFSNGPQIVANGPGTYFKAGNIYSDPLTDNVGIGITHPLFKLNLYSTTEDNKIIATDNIYPDGPLTIGHGYNAASSGYPSPENINSKIEFINTAPTAYFGDAITFSTTQNVALPLNSDTSTERMRITSDGNVGIGVTSSITQRLHLQNPNYCFLTVEAGGYGTMNIGASGNYGVIYTTNNSPIVFDSGNSEKMRLTPSGNLGIGTTSPSEKLEVSGSTIIIGSATIGSSSLGSSENTLTLGPAPGGGAGEGGQLGLAATGGSYISASFIDVYQDTLRILKGTNAGSISGMLVFNMATNQAQFLGAVTASAYSGLPNDYLYATRSGSNQTVGSAWANTDVIFNNVVVSKGISFNTSTGVASLTGGKVYRVTARIAWQAAATYNLQFSCYTSANTKIGPDVEIIQSPNGTYNISDGTLEFIYAPSGNTDIKIRCTANNTALSGEQIRYDLNTQFIIQQIA